MSSLVFSKTKDMELAWVDGQLDLPPAEDEDEEEEDEELGSSEEKSKKKKGNDRQLTEECHTLAGSVIIYKSFAKHGSHHS